MSIRLMKEVRKLRLSASEMSVLHCYADYADDEEHLAYPSIQRVAWDTCLSESQVHRTVAKLRSLDLLVATSPTVGGRGHSTTYRICPENGVMKTPFVPVNTRTMTPISHEKGSVMTPIQPVKGVMDDDKGCHFDSLKGVMVTPQPSYEPEECANAHNLRARVREAAPQPKDCARVLNQPGVSGSSGPPSVPGSLPYDPAFTDWVRHEFSPRYPLAVSPLDLPALYRAAGSPEGRAKVMERLRVWAESDRFQRGIVWSVRNWLEQGHWLSDPPAPARASPSVGSGKAAAAEAAIAQSKSNIRDYMTKVRNGEK